MGAVHRTVKLWCANGTIRAELVKGNGGTQYRVPLEALPPAAQIRYWVGQLKAVPMTDRRAYMHTLPIPDALVRKVAQAAARRPAAPRPRRRRRARAGLRTARPRHHRSRRAARRAAPP